MSFAESEESTVEKVKDLPSAEELAATLAATGRAFIEVSTSTEEAAEAFRRAAEAARLLSDPETEIALIKANPSLSRFRKWWLVRKIKRAWQW